MKRFFITAIVAVFAFAAVNAQLLYRISGNGLSKPSYLIGTHHFANASFIDKIPGAKEAFVETDQVYGEIKWDDMMSPDSLQMMMEKEKLPDGKTLKDVLPADQYSKLDAYLKRTMGVGFENPMVAAQMGTLTPAALQTRLTLIMYMQDHTVDFDPTNSFDLYFQSQAQKSNKPQADLRPCRFRPPCCFRAIPWSARLSCFHACSTT